MNKQVSEMINDPSTTIEALVSAVEESERKRIMSILGIDESIENTGEEFEIYKRLERMNRMALCLTAVLLTSLAWWAVL